MLDFRKVLLAAGLAALGLVGTASAQTGGLVCTGSTAGSGGNINGAPPVAPTASAIAPNQGFPASVAIEGTAELLPAFTLQCNNATVQAGTAFNILLTANAPIANVIPAGGKNLDVVASTNNAADTNTVTLASASTIQITFTVKNTANITTLNVAGIRVNPSTSPALSAITLSETSTSIPTLGTVGTMAYVQNSLNPPAITGAANLNYCAVVANTVYPVASLTVSGGFLDSLHQLSEINGPFAYAGAATPTIQATVIQVVFNNLITAGVNYYVPGGIAGTNVALTAVTSAAGTTAATVGANGVLLTPNSAGQATVFYIVTGDAGALQPESAAIPLTEAVPTLTGVTTFTTTPVSAVISLASASTYPGYTGTPTYSATQKTVANTNGLVIPCATTILFPYVTSAGGFDTGIALTNASTGASTTENPVAAASGTCAVQFYGAPLPSTNPYVTATVGTGAAAVQVLDVASVAPGFTGYAVATCNFQGGHGYAFLSNGFATNTGVAANYIGVVLGNANLNALAGLVAPITGVVAQ